MRDVLVEGVKLAAASLRNVVQALINAGRALGEVLASGLRALNNNPQCSEADLRAAMEGTGRSVAHRLEKYLAALATRNGWAVWCATS